MMTDPSYFYQQAPVLCHAQYQHDNGIHQASPGATPTLQRGQLRTLQIKRCCHRTGGYTKILFRINVNSKLKNLLC